MSRSSPLFTKSGRVYVWRTPKEACIPERLVSTVKHGGKSVLIWAAISWYSTGLIITLYVRIIASDYMDILGNQVHPMVQILFPDNDARFKVTDRPYTQAEVFSRGLRNVKLHFNSFPGQHSRET